MNANARDAGLLDSQRRRIFALGRSRGLDIDGIRELTPAGSISKMSRVQADRLIRRLEGARNADQPRRHTQEQVTGRQLRAIEHLAFELLGFTGQGFNLWLGRFGVASLDQVENRELARRIIAGLTILHGVRVDPRMASGRGGTAHTLKR